MIKKVSGCGGLVLLGGIAVVGVMLYAMGLFKYIVAYGQILQGLASNPDSLPAHWISAEAQVVNIEHRTDKNYRQMARVVLRYADASGKEQVGTFEVASPSRGLGRIKSEDRLTIQVCRHDPTILKSDRFVLSGQEKCVQRGDR